MSSKRATMFSYDLAKKKLPNTSNILHFLMEIYVLSGNNLDLTIPWVWFFDISMLLYGEILKLAGLTHFLAYFGPY